MNSNHAITNGHQKATASKAYTIMTNVLGEVSKVGKQAWSFTKKTLWITTTVAILFIIPLGFEINHDQTKIL